MALVSEDGAAMEAIRFWTWKKDGFLPSEGGWTDQDSWFVEAVEIMQQSIDEVAAREAAKRQAELDRIKNRR